MASMPAKGLSTVYEDFLAVPDPFIAEIINGALVTQPRPGSPHARASTKLGASLDGPFDRGKGGPGGWIILDEPELHLHGDILVPDLAGWRRDRTPKLPKSAAIELPPDWVCEVLSPRTAATDRADKMPIYAREGVGHVCLIDPDPCTLEAYRLDGEGWRLLGTWRGEALVRAEPFDALELELGELWSGLE